MSTHTPIVRKTAWVYTIPQLLLMFALMLFVWKIFLPDNFLRASAYGATIYLIYSFGSRALLLKNHRRGIYLVKRESYRDAIDEFRLSYQFLNKYSWLDKYRFITMLASTAVSYREMALINIAYSHAQLNDKVAAMKSYRRVLKAFPESEMAKSGIEYLESEKLQFRSVTAKPTSARGTRQGRCLWLLTDTTWRTPLRVPCKFRR